MTSVPSVRRRAEQFNSLVEGTSTGDGRAARPTADLGAYLDLVDSLREIPVVEPSPEFTSSLREQLLAAADTLLLPSEDTQRLTLPPRRTARDRRLAAVVGGLAVVGASASLAVAAQSALPGEMLYPLKRAMESAETGIHTTDEGKGASLLANATGRLDEVAALSRTDDVGEDAAIESTLTTFSDQAILASDLLLGDYAENGDQASIEELRSFTADSMQTLTALESLLPEEARDELVHAAEVLGQIDAAAGEACPGCRGGITEVPAFLLSAGQVAEPDVVVVPPVIGAADDNQGSDGGKGQGKQGGEQSDGSKNGGSGDGSGGPVTTPVNPGTPHDQGGGAGAGSGNPLDLLTDPLTGGDGTNANGGGKGGHGKGGGITGIPEVDDIIDDVDDALPDLP